MPGAVMREPGKEREREKVFDENEFVAGRDATHDAPRRNNLFDDFSV